MKKEILHLERSLGSTFWEIIEAVYDAIDYFDNFTEIEEKVRHILECYNNQELEFNNMGAVTGCYLPMDLTIFSDEKQIRIAEANGGDDFIVIRVY